MQRSVLLCPSHDTERLRDSSQKCLAMQERGESAALLVGVKGAGWDVFEAAVQAAQVDLVPIEDHVDVADFVDALSSLSGAAASAAAPLSEAVRLMTWRPEGLAERAVARLLAQHGSLDAICAAAESIPDDASDADRGLLEEIGLFLTQDFYVE